MQCSEAVTYTFRLTVDAQANVDHQQNNGEHCQADGEHVAVHSGFTAHHGHNHYKEQQRVSTGAPAQYCSEGGI